MQIDAKERRQMEEKRSSRDIVTARITEMILTGQLKPDDQLPPERELAQSMGISRKLCSDIIKELERRGLLVVVPRQGVFVNDFRHNGNIYTLEALMNVQFELQPQEIRSLLEFRWAMELLACKRVIETASDQEIADLGHMLDKVLDSGSAEEAALCTYEYYHKLAVLSGNSIIPMTTLGFKTSTIKLWQRYVNNFGISQLYKSLAQIYFHIRQRDFEGVFKQLSKSTTETISGDYSIYKDL